ncbi:MAG: ABC transporter permease [Candidatus Rokubacteria bacterium]|nr:ABC transporter permease [Candidatus Rokubacteria bacterium]
MGLPRSATERAEVRAGASSATIAPPALPRAAVRGDGYPAARAGGAPIAARARGWARSVLRFAHRKPLGAASGAVLTLCVLAALLAPVVSPHDPVAQDVPNQFRSPDRTYWMGTDHLGRDVLSRIIHGARISLSVGFLAVGVAALIGIVAGTSSAYFGGLLDLLLQRVIDTMMGVPALVVAMVIMFVLGSSLTNVVLAITVAYTPQFVRIVRSEALAVKETDYVVAAAASGASSARVLGFHIIPNTLTSVFVFATGALGGAIVAEASLSFLGLGIPPPAPSWGQMLQGAARLHMETFPWLVIFPGLTITLVVYAFNMLGDALRDVLDPRLRER